MLARIQCGWACGKHVFHGESRFRYSVSLALSTNWVLSSRRQTFPASQRIEQEWEKKKLNHNSTLTYPGSKSTY